MNTTRDERSRADSNNQEQSYRADRTTKILDQADQYKQEGSRSRQFTTNQKSTMTHRDDQKARLQRKSPTENQHANQINEMQAETTTQQIMAYQDRPR